MATFDAQEVLSLNVPLRGKEISQEICKLCNDLSARIAITTFDRVKI